jgi:hypothetical protein
LTPELFRQLAALGLSTEQMAGVLEIMEADAEVRKAKGRERVQKWRERKAGNVTKRHVTPENVSERLTRADDAPATEENKQTNKEEKIDASPSAQPKRGVRLPEDFAPDIQWPVAQGLSFSEAQTEAAQFKDYWSTKVGKDALKANWPAAWRMWIRNHVKRRATAPPKRAAPAETVGSLSLRQLYGPRNDNDVTDNPTGRVEASGPRRLEASPGASGSFTVPRNILGSF